MSFLKKRESLALGILAFLLIGLPAIVFGIEYGLRSRSDGLRVITIDMAVPEAGGFSTDSIQVAAGETVILRFRSQDVTHGVAIGPGTGIDLGQIDPGQVSEVEVTFDKPGTYTYYCNTWCSTDHWRMRGIIEVRDPDHPDLIPTAQVDPVIEALLAEGIDIDAGLHTDDEIVDEHEHIELPSVINGERLLDTVTIPDQITSFDWRRTHSPNQAVELLAQFNPQVSQADLRDVVAALWFSEVLPDIPQLYNKNCAACHGETGGGDGPAALDTAEKPTAFDDSAHMFDMRSDVLYAKLRRGGMGTDMPNFGTLFTPEETWSLVDYIWHLAFEVSD